MRCCLALCIFAVALTPLHAQHHSGSPPTAPARPAPPPVAVNSGLGPIQFDVVNYGVPAPQSLTRQLRSDDERTRASALSALGVPGQYLQRGHIPTPHSMQLSFEQLGNDDDLDAILTVELDQHIVTAILIPDGDNWRRVATFLVSDAFSDPSNIPTTFIQTDRSPLVHGHYRALFRATEYDAHANLAENEAQFMLINKHPVVLISFVSQLRDCSTAPPTPGKPAPASTGCDITHRWLASDPADPAHRFNLITASGHLSPKESMGPLGTDPLFVGSRLHTFSCQPFTFSDQTQRLEPTANSTPCATK